MRVEGKLVGDVLRSGQGEGKVGRRVGQRGLVDREELSSASIYSSFVFFGKPTVVTTFQHSTLRKESLCPAGQKSERGNRAEQEVEVNYFLGRSVGLEEVRPDGKGFDMFARCCTELPRMPTARFAFSSNQI